MVGVIPLKVMGPPVVMVMVPVTNPELSATGVATMVSCWGVLEPGLLACAGVMAVGMVLGAV